MNALLSMSAAVLVFASVSSAQDDRPPSEQQAAQPESLRGPDVPDRARRTLLHRSMTGEFQRVQGRPEAAAVQLLDLDESAREAVTATIDARDMAVAMLLVEEIDAVKEISDAIIAEEGDRARELTIELWQRFEPGTPRSPLFEPLTEVLTPEQHAEVVRIADEYWEARIDWELRGRADAMAEMDEDRVEAARKQVQDRLAFQLFQQEIRAGYDATLLRYRQAMDAIYEAVQPTDEQKELMREILIDHIRETQLQPTPAQRRLASRRMYDVLDEERRGMMYDYMLRFVIPDQGGN